MESLAALGISGVAAALLIGAVVGLNEIVKNASEAIKFAIAKKTDAMIDSIGTVVIIILAGFFGGVLGYMSPEMSVYTGVVGGFAAAGLYKLRNGSDNKADAPAVL